MLGGEGAVNEGSPPVLNIAIDGIISWVINCWR